MGCDQGQSWDSQIFGLMGYNFKNILDNDFECKTRIVMKWSEELEPVFLHFSVSIASDKFEIWQ